MIRGEGSTLNAIPRIVVAAVLLFAFSTADFSTAAFSTAAFTTSAYAQTGPDSVLYGYEGHFRAYTGSGAPFALSDLDSLLAAADVAFVGEEHNDPVAHAVELYVLHRAAQSGRPAALSLEMFARDDQLPLNEYLAGLVPERHFLGAVSEWDNYESDYRPLVEYARESDLPVIAANAPRRYANLVTRRGPDALTEISAEGKRYLAPVPHGPASDVYRNEWMTYMSEAMAAHGGGAGDSTDTDSTAAESAETDETGPDSTAAPAAPMGMPSMSNMFAAQVLWDATMAYSIADHQLRNPGTLVVHAVGSFHVKNGTGTPEQYMRYRPGAQVLIITVIAVDDIDTFQTDAHSGAGDIVIYSDMGLPRSYE